MNITSLSQLNLAAQIVEIADRRRDADRASAAAGTPIGDLDAYVLQATHDVVKVNNLLLKVLQPLEPASAPPHEAG